jgi:hypothetical protein
MPHTPPYEALSGSANHFPNGHDAARNFTFAFIKQPQCEQIPCRISGHERHCRHRSTIICSSDEYAFGFNNVNGVTFFTRATNPPDTSRQHAYTSTPN